MLAPHFFRSWIIADGLINYEGGFVRRGLPGETALVLARLLHLPTALFPVLFCGILYGVLLPATRALALRATPSWWTMALLVPPATFAFPLLDTSGAGRQELIYLAALALLLVLLQKPRLSPRNTSLFLTGGAGRAVARGGHLLHALLLRRGHAGGPQLSRGGAEVRAVC